MDFAHPGGAITIRYRKRSMGHGATGQRLLPPTNPEPPGRSGMRDPVFPATPVGTVTIWTGNQWAGGGNAGNQLQNGSTLFFRQVGQTAWTAIPLQWAVTLGNNKYYSAAIPAATLVAGTGIQYYLRIPYDDHDRHSCS